MQIYLPSEEMVMQMHDVILEVSGGKPGVLDKRVIEAAVHRPKTYLSYHDDCDLHTVCAVLLDSIARNHAFVEGNKRTGLMTALLTYELNGIAMKQSADRTKDFEDLVLWVVLEKPEIPQIAERSRQLAEKYREDRSGKLAAVFRKLLTPFNSD